MRAAPMTLGEIASRLGGRVAGDAQTLIRQVGSLERAGAGEISFFTSSRYKASLAETRAAAVILSTENEALTALPRIVCEHPYAFFARVSQLFNPLTLQAPGVHPSAVGSGAAKLGARVSVGPKGGGGGGGTIGDDSCLYPRAMGYSCFVLGARVIVHNRAA